MNIKLLYAASFCVLVVACTSNSEEAKGKFIETGYMDSAIKPGDNFFEFINGKWYDTVHIAETESGSGAFYDLYYGTRDRLHELLDSISKNEQKAGSIEQKAGDFYASGMDSATIEKRGYDPVKPYLQQIDSLKDAKGIMTFVNQRQLENENLLFSQGVAPDEKNSSVNIALYVQSGLGLPDRDYYFKTDTANQKIVDAYTTYMKKLFMLVGDDSSKAAIETAQVYALEKQMASSHKTNVELRDPQSNYHKMAIADLDKQMPVFAWKNTLSTLGIHSDSVNVSQPAYYIKLDQLLKSIPVDVWKSYLKFHILDDAASSLSSDFVITRFEYSGKALSGQQKLKPRWQRMVVNTDNNLGDALGQLYVDKYFNEAAKARMLELVNNLQTAFAITGLII